MPHRKNITLVFNHFETEHFGKDVFLVPYYLGKIYNLDVTIVFPETNTNKDFPSNLQGVLLRSLKNPFSKKPYSGLRILKELVFIFYVIRNAKKMNILMRFHLSEETVLTGFLYKLLNPKGFLYIKSDTDGTLQTLNDNFSIMSLKLPFKLLKRLIYKYFLKTFDLLTVETKTVYHASLDFNILGMAISPKTRLLHNGFDKEKFLKYNFRNYDFSEKENLIITVGRLGTKQKNTELLLKAIEKIDLKEWKVLFIGFIEKEETDFQKYIDNFYLKYSNLQEKVFFTGPIYDKEKLWEIYNKAKIFVLTSRWEGFANVFSEALVFRNYIISTDVGGASDMIEMGYGELIPKENASFLQKTLQRIINEDRLGYLYKTVNWENIDISWEAGIKKAFSGFL